MIKAAMLAIIDMQEWWEFGKTQVVGIDNLRLGCESLIYLFYLRIRITRIDGAW